MIRQLTSGVFMKRSRKPISKIPESMAISAYFGGEKPIGNWTGWKTYVDWLYKQKIITFKDRMRWRRKKIN
jgi:hypothetical protein